MTNWGKEKRLLASAYVKIVSAIDRTALGYKVRYCLAMVEILRFSPNIPLHAAIWSSPETLRAWSSLTYSGKPIAIANFAITPSQ